MVNFEGISNEEADEPPPDIDEVVRDSLEDYVQRYANNDYVLPDTKSQLVYYLDEEGLWLESYFKMEDNPQLDAYSDTEYYPTDEENNYSDTLGPDMAQHLIDYIISSPSIDFESLNLVTEDDDDCSKIDKSYQQGLLKSSSKSEIASYRLGCNYN